MKKFKPATIALSLKTKLVFTSILLLIIPLLSTGIISYNIAKSELNKKGEVILKNGVHQAMQFIASKQEEVKKGSITLAEAQEDVKVYLLGAKDSDGKRPTNKTIDLGKNGYFVVYDASGLEVAHPSLEGQNVWDLEDKSNKGFKFVQEQIKVGQNSGGFVQYVWTLPSSSQTGEKISYQEEDPEWGWIVSAGSYLSDYNEGSNTILKTLGIVFLISLILGILIIIRFADHISHPIKRISQGLEDIAQGDLTTNELLITNRDETGRLAQSFNKMLNNMRSLLSATKESSTNVMKFSDSLALITAETSNAINSVAMTIQEVARTANEEAKDTENAARQIDILANNIEEVTQATSVMEQIAAETAQSNTKGLETVSLLVKTKDDSIMATEEIGEAILKVSQSTGKIHLIIESITQISQQTNLLALNASIEAARAGESGKGFAVVAEEIRKLAEQSAKAVEEIETIIGEINVYSTSSVKTMELTKKAAQEQDSAVKDTNSAFENISNALLQLIESINKVSQESISMKEMKNEIVGTISNISASTQQTAASAQQVSASSEEQLAAMEEVSGGAQKLKETSVQMDDIINKFKL